MKRILSFALLTLLAQACTKDVKQVTGYTITHVATANAGDTVFFSSNAPDKSVFMWTFGDSSNDASAKPVHVYAAAGKYYVTLTVNGDISSKVTDSIVIGSRYTDRLAGVWNMHHSYTDAYPWAPYHTTYLKPDTTLNIRVVDPLHIVLDNDTMVMYPGFNPDSTISFYAPHALYPVVHNSLDYNFFTTRLSYTRVIHISAGAGNATDAYYSY